MTESSTYGNITISHKYYHITMICDIATLPYNTIMTYGNFYDTMWYIMFDIYLIPLFLFVFSRQNRDRISDYLGNFPTLDSVVLPMQKVNRLRLQHTQKDSNK